MKKILKKIKWRHPILAILVCLFVVVVVVFFGRRYAFNQIGTNIYLNEMPVSGLNYDAASEVIEDAFNSYLSNEVNIVVNDVSYSFKPEEIGIEFDTIQTLERIHLVDYGENFFEGVKSQVNRFFNDIEIQPVLHTDVAKFTDTLQETIEELRSPENASVIVNEENIFTATSHENGLNASYEEAYNLLIEQARSMQSMSVQLDTEVIYADVTDENAQAAALVANDYTSRNLELFYKHDSLSKSYNLQLQNDWLRFEEVDSEIVVEIDEDRLQEYLINEVSVDIDRDAEDAKLISLPEDGGSYALVEGVAKDGRKLDIESTVKSILTAIEDDMYDVELSVVEVKGKIINETDENLGDLSHLATGISNWEGSPDGRDFNIRKGLSEKVNNIFLAPGEEYNFNQNLGPVTHAAGWKDSLAIFGGKNLVAVPGGGLCQVSTTVYRAALNAGLEVTERSNHSLYVHYYKAYGDGLDAAIYPGSKNLRFVNDTGNYMLIQAYDDGYDGYVKIYGTSDGRSTEFAGPFYPKDIPNEWKDRLLLRYNQIGWWYKIYDANGDVLVDKQLTGTYRSIPY